MLGVLVEPSGVAVTRQSSRSSAVRPSNPLEGVKHQMKNFSTLTRREDGQTMAEYGVVLAVITGLIVIALLALSGAIADALNTVRGYL